MRLQDENYVSDSFRFLSGRWSTFDLDYGAGPAPSEEYASSSTYSKSYEFYLAVGDRDQFKKFLCVFAAVVAVITATAFLVAYLPRRGSEGEKIDLALALDLALKFFDAQKSGVLPANNAVKFRGDSGLNDIDHTHGEAHSLVGGFYDSGNNIKFSLPTAYTISLLSWTVVEYHHKYSQIGQLQKVEEIIRWGADYLLKLYVPSNSADQPPVLYSQVGGENDINCWQRPEDMTYARPITSCNTSAVDLAGEIVAALASASIALKRDNPTYSNRLVATAESLFKSVMANPKHETYVSRDGFYKSDSFLDELAWGATWLFLATGEGRYLEYATEMIVRAVETEKKLSWRVFDWNNKLAANVVLMSRLRYLNDPGYPYETTLKNCTEMATAIMCSYISPPKWSGLIPSVSPGGLIFPSVAGKSPLHFAATAAFLGKLYGDYLDLIMIPRETCSGGALISSDVLRRFAKFQVNYILGNNPMKMSYLVGFGDRYPKQVHHRGASIPMDGHRYNCTDGKIWRKSKEPNPNVLIGAMVAGPGQDDRFMDVRDMAEYTEATIAGNAGLVAALVALVDSENGVDRGIDRDGIFANI